MADESISHLMLVPPDFRDVQAIRVQAREPGGEWSAAAVDSYRPHGWTVFRAKLVEPLPGGTEIRAAVEIDGAWSDYSEPMIAVPEPSGGLVAGALLLAALMRRKTLLNPARSTGGTMKRANLFLALALILSVALGCSQKQLDNFDKTQAKVCDQIEELQAEIALGTQLIPNDRAQLIMGLTYQQALIQCGFADAVVEPRVTVTSDPAFDEIGGIIWVSP